MKTTSCYLKPYNITVVCCFYSDFGFLLMRQAPRIYRSRINNKSLPICNQLQTGIIFEPGSNKNWNIINLPNSFFHLSIHGLSYMNERRIGPTHTYVVTVMFVNIYFIAELNYSECLEIKAVQLLLTSLNQFR